MAKFGKKNHVSINLLDYSTCLLGEAKVGKTTLIKEVCEKIAGEDGYLFLEFGDERGAAAIENINYENVESWWSDEEEDIVGFADIVDDICENKITPQYNILFLFQPSEEITGGSLEVIKSGVLEKYNVEEEII